MRGDPRGQQLGLGASPSSSCHRACGPSGFRASAHRPCPERGRRRRRSRQRPGTLATTGRPSPLTTSIDSYRRISAFNKSVRGAGEPRWRSRVLPRSAASQRAWPCRPRTAHRSGQQRASSPPLTRPAPAIIAELGPILGASPSRIEKSGRGHPARTGQRAGDRASEYPGYFSLVCQFVDGTMSPGRATRVTKPGTSLSAARRSSSSVIR